MSATDVRLDAHEVARLLRRPAPTPEQVAVVEAPLAPLLVVAGAGSGKTETMAARVVHLIANGLVAPEQVLGLTFTRKAAGELAERVRHRLRALRTAVGDLPGTTAEGRRGSPLVGPTIRTYNAYAAGLVGDHAARLGIEPSSRLLGEAGRWQLAHEVVERWQEDLGVDLAPTTVTEALLDLSGALAEHLRDPEDLRAEARRLVEHVSSLPPGEKDRAGHRDVARRVVQSLGLRERLVDLVAEVTARKRAADLLDFADQVAIAARLAREVPEVGRTERSRFAVVLLDEYQDTSVAQLELLAHLFGGAGEGAGHAVTAVGDPHQSIYGWRGASAGGLSRFPTQFPDVGSDGRRVPARVLALSTSWRNDRAVLRAANTVAAPLRASASGAVRLPVLAARPDAGDGEVAVAVLETVEDEARAVAEFVGSRREALRGARAAAAEGSGPVTAAVLCRKRSQFPAMQAALRAAGLPVEVVGLGGLLSTPEVVDLVAALEAVHDPSRGDSLMRLLTGPRARLGLADLLALGDWAAEQAWATSRRGGATPGGRDVGDRENDVVDERSIVDALDELPGRGWRSREGRALSDVGRGRLAELGHVLRLLRGRTHLPLPDLVADVERALLLDVEVAAVPGRSPATARAALDAFRAVAASFSDGADVATLGAFLAWLDAAQREERGLEAPVAEMDPEAVQLLTVHAAKGLEWDVVAVPGLVERTFPDAGKSSGWVLERGELPVVLRGDRESLPDVDLAGATDLADLAARVERYKDEHADHLLAEEQRLAYVAVTRARAHLLLTGSWWRDGARPVAPSVFLRDVAGDPDVGARVLVWTDDPTAPDEDGATRRPTKPEPPAQDPPVWPSPAPLGAGRQHHVERAAELVRTAMAGGAGAGRVDDPAGGQEDDPADEVVRLLLDERRRRHRELATVALPAHLSTSAVVRLASDEEEFARQLRRPVPLPPSPHARRGTAFHAWVERYYGHAALLDVDTLPGADDETADGADDLAALQERFLASEWAHRSPVAVEVDVETPVGGVVVRSRIDAVFAEPGGHVVVVDWKTGRPPTTQDARRTRDVQLAVYRLSWARRSGTPLDRVSAAYFYASTGETVRPERLLEVTELDDLVRRATPVTG